MMNFIAHSQWAVCGKYIESTKGAAIVFIITFSSYVYINLLVISAKLVVE